MYLKQWKYLFEIRDFAIPDTPSVPTPECKSEEICFKKEGSSGHKFWRTLI